MNAREKKQNERTEELKKRYDRKFKLEDITHKNKKELENIIHKNILEEIKAIKDANITAFNRVR